MSNDGGAMVAADGRGGGGGKKWTGRFPVYQIDFTVMGSGKRVASTKRRIRWRFGFSNKEALENGETGTSCRGEEHEVTIIWSVTSGKRLILADGQEVHYSTNRGTVFEFSWTMRGNHVVKVIAHATPQLTGNPEFRQYDLVVDGQSFFDMPKVYELGIKGNIYAPYPGVIRKEEQPPPVSDSRAYYDLGKGEYVKEPRTREEEEQDLKAAIQASLQESKTHLDKSSSDKHDKELSPISNQSDIVHTQPPNTLPPNTLPIPPPPDHDLLDLDADFNTMSIVPTQTNTPTPYTYDGINLVQQPNQPHQQPTPTPQTDPFAPTYDAVPPQTAQTAPPQPTYDAFSPQTAQTAPPQPTYDAFSPQKAQTAPPQPTYDAFAPKPPLQTNIYDQISHNIINQYNIPPHHQPTDPLPTQPSPRPTDQPSIDQPPISLRTPEEPEKPQNPFDNTLSKLVNFDDITSPVEPSSKLTMKEPKDASKSKGIAPMASTWGGAQPTLAQMQSIRPPNAQQGQMALSSTQNGNYGGYAQTTPGAPQGHSYPQQQQQWASQQRGYQQMYY